MIKNFQQKHMKSFASYTAKWLNVIISKHPTNKCTPVIDVSSFTTFFLPFAGVVH